MLRKGSLGIGPRRLRWGGVGRLKECVREWEQAVAAGRDERVHRVARPFFEAGSDLRAALDGFILSDYPLERFANLYVELRSYSANIIVSRRVEGIHSQVKRTFERKLHCLIPRVSASVRQKELEGQLDNQNFLDWLRRSWRRRGWLQTAVCIAFPRSEHFVIQNLSQRDMVRMFYQCSERTMYRPPPIEKHDANVWKAQMKTLSQPVAPLIADSTYHLVGWMKRQCARSQVYWSMARSQFRQQHGDDFVPLELHEVLPHLSAALDVAPPPPVLQEQVVFRVSSAYPEAKDILTAGHVDSAKTLINIEVFDARVQDGCLQVSDGCGVFERFDLAKIAHLHRMGQLWCWQVSSMVCEPCFSQQGRSALQGSPF